MKRLARVFMACTAFLAAGAVWIYSDGFWSGCFAFYLAAAGALIAIMDVSVTHTEPDYVHVPDSRVFVTATTEVGYSGPPNPRPKPRKP